MPTLWAPGRGYAFTDLATGEDTVVATGYPPVAAAPPLDEGGVDDHDIELGHFGA
ncbi:hypothetical protein ACFWWT_40260 [Streptomyces sp. NPDC058676]|uniref:hypothetical protein n=1 Tax=unclassified Streptomyces TaxID=2593676 RepID=UPI00365091DA